MKRIFAVLLFAICLVSCNKNRFKIDTDKVDLNLKIERFDKDFMTLNPSNIQNMNQRYGDLFQHYCINVMRLGVPNNATFWQNYQGLLKDSMANAVYKETEKIFDVQCMDSINTEILNAFKYVKYYFPNKRIPHIATHFSGFGQNVIATPHYLSISLDDYLGANYAPYEEVVYDYQRQNMKPQNVASDLLLGYLMSEFPAEDSGTLLNCMISRGKWVFLERIFLSENRSDADIMGYTSKQMQWCVDNEKNMWSYLMEHKMLYNTQQLVIAKFINNAPFTAYFPQDSPGQAAIWLGYRIVKSYMDSNTDVTLQELMDNKNYQQILEQSNYKPE